MRAIGTLLLTALVIFGTNPVSAKFVTPQTLGEAWAKDSGSVESLAFSPDEKLLATTSGGSIRLWEVATGVLLQTLPGDPTSVRSVAFSPDGRLLASGGFDNFVKVWEVSSGKQLHAFQNKSTPQIVVFAP